MQLVEEEEQRWYCLKDDQLWLGHEQRWLKSKQEMGVYDAFYVDGYRNITGKLATISLSEQSIKIKFSDPSADSSNALELEFPYSSIEVLNVTQEREITALRTWLIGPVFAAWFKKKTLTLTIGVREKDGLLQLPSFKMETGIINSCYDNLYDRIRKERG